MMNREQIINKVMEQYGKYEVTKERVEKLYDSAIQIGVAGEVIYPGIKLMLNTELGFKDEEVVKQIGIGFAKYIIRETKSDNPTASDKVLAERFVEEIKEFIDDDTLPISKEMKDSVITTMEDYIGKNL